MIRSFLGATLAAALLLSACGQPADDSSVTPTDTALVTQDTSSVSETAGTNTAVTAAVRDGVQEVRIAVRNDGYHPNRIALEQGIPARMVFVQEANSPCASEVQIPAFDIEKTALPQGQETAIEFTPDESGEFTFVCGMEMLSGTILVRS